MKFSRLDFIRFKNQQGKQRIDFSIVRLSFQTLSEIVII